ncbi:hypothetical protein G997_02886 [Escherichia coli UMEA 3834-1]|nr:hypothetical protein G997_02886 [Escherichia coli UMEA 3834-1]
MALDSYASPNIIPELRQPNAAAGKITLGGLWICPYISRHLLSLNPSLAHCRRYSRGER